MISTVPVMPNKTQYTYTKSMHGQYKKEDTTLREMPQEVLTFFLSMCVLDGINEIVSEFVCSMQAPVTACSMTQYKVFAVNYSSPYLTLGFLGNPCTPALSSRACVGALFAMLLLDPPPAPSSW